MWRPSAPGRRALLLLDKADPFFQEVGSEHDPPSVQAGEIEPEVDHEGRLGRGLADEGEAAVLERQLERPDGGAAASLLGKERSLPELLGEALPDRAAAGVGVCCPVGLSTGDQCCQIEGKRESPVELAAFLRGEAADVVGENGLRKADEIITVNAAVVFEPLLDADRDLAVKAVTAGVDRSADHA